MDVASDLQDFEKDLTSFIFRDVDAVFLVVDAGSKTSLLDADSWTRYPILTLTLNLTLNLTLTLILI